jgi:hypothetical protein
VKGFIVWKEMVFEIGRLPQWWIDSDKENDEKILSWEVRNNLEIFSVCDTGRNLIRENAVKRKGEEA